MLRSCKNFKNDLACSCPDFRKMKKFLTAQNGCKWKHVALATRLESTIASPATEDVKPFHDIPGPGGPPYFGTYFMYKSGISLSLSAFPFNFVG